MGPRNPDAIGLTNLASEAELRLVFAPGMVTENHGVGSSILPLGTIA
jgi:hypothetical protein